MDYRRAIESSVDCFLASTDVGLGALADAMGMTDKALVCKLHGPMEFTLSETVHLAGILGCTLDELTGFGKDQQ